MVCMTGRPCSVCKTTGDLGKTFAACEWDKPDDERKCFMCMARRCSKCRRDKTKGSFSADQWRLPDGAPALVCYDCNRKQCSSCFKPKGQKEFDRHTWQLEDKDPGRTRVRKREHLLIYRDFPREPFTQGPPENQMMLLKTIKR